MSFFPYHFPLIETISMQWDLTIFPVLKDARVVSEAQQLHLARIFSVVIWYVEPSVRLTVIKVLGHTDNLVSQKQIER